MEPLHDDVVTIKNGKVTKLKNNAVILADGDPAHVVLRTLFDAGWEIQGDYELTIVNDRASQISGESQSDTRPTVRASGTRKK